MNNENPFEPEQQYSCFNCDCEGGGYYRPHVGETDWYLGLDLDGQAHYACQDCVPLLIAPVPVEQGVECGPTVLHM